MRRPTKTAVRKIIRADFERGHKRLIDALITKGGTTIVEYEVRSKPVTVGGKPKVHVQVRVVTVPKSGRGSSSFITDSWLEDA